MNERYIKWYTPYLSCEFEMLVFGAKSGLPLILFPNFGGPLLRKQGFRAGRCGGMVHRKRQSHRLLPGRNRSAKLLTINRFTLPIECGRTTRSKTSSFATYSTSRDANAVDSAARFA